MDPKILVVLGAGAFMFLLLVIVGVVAWVNSEEEDDEVTTDSPGVGSGSGDSNDPAPPTLVDPETSTLSNCPDGHVRMDPYPAPCYPKCRGGFAWAMAAEGTSNVDRGGGCGTSDGSKVWSLGGSTLRAKEAEACGQRFTKANLSKTGYVQCIAPDDDGGATGFCLNYKDGTKGTNLDDIVQCVPDNHSDGALPLAQGQAMVGYEKWPSMADNSKKIPVCATNIGDEVHGAWNYGGYGKHVGDKWTNVKDSSNPGYGGSCICPEGYNFTWHGSQGVGSGNGNDGSNNLWSCQ